MSPFEEVFSNAKERMEKAIQSTQNELSGVRTGSANPQLLDRVSVDYYGTPTPLNQMANISVSDGQTLVIKPYDKGALAEIEKAIAKSELGLTPNNDGEILRISIPPLSEERRQEMVKLVKKMGEEGKVAIRNIRRDATDSIKKFEGEDGISEDSIKQKLDEMQKLTDNCTGDLETIVSNKEKELLTI